MPDDSTIRLVSRLRKGDQDAASELFRRYSSQLIALTRSRLSTIFSSRFDAEDIVQSVYRSFFAGACADRFEIAHGGDLWHLLVAMAAYKLRDQFKFHTANKRSVRAEQAPPGDSSADDEMRYGIPAEVLRSEPSAVEAVALSEEVEYVMRQLDTMERTILELRLQGQTHSQISQAAGCSERNVIRVLKVVKQLLEQRWSQVG